MTDGGLWRIALDVAPGDAAVFEAALEPFCETVSRFGDEDDGARRVEGLARAQPDQAALGVSLALAAACRGVPAPEARVEPLSDIDWLADNRVAFAPFTIGRWFVHGSQAGDPVPSGHLGLAVDAATAFGSGRHGSTAGCLSALDGLACRRFRRPLDMGCGSGILAIAAAKLWRVPVLAIDADREAVAVTRRNARANGVPHLVRPVHADGYRSPAIAAASPFDLIVCNILARPIRAMAKQLARRLAAGGVAVLSGFLARDAGGVLAAHRVHGPRLVRRITVDGWSTLVVAS